MRVVYVDTLFFLNAVVDYLLLLGAARLVGEPLHRGRFVVGALLGGMYAVALFLPGWAFLSEPICRVVCCLLMAVAAYGGSRRLLRQSVVFLALACGFGGVVLCVGFFGEDVMQNGIIVTEMDLKTVLLSAALCYGILSVGFRRFAAHTVCAGELLQADLWLRGRSVSLTALVDTGNTLTDPATGKPVIVAEGEKLKELFPQDHCPSAEDMRNPSTGLERLGTDGWQGRFRLLPFRAVGIERGLLLAVRLDRFVLEGEEKGALMVALSPTPVSDGGGYCALVGVLD